MKKKTLEFNLLVSISVKNYREDVGESLSPGIDVDRCICHRQSLDLIHCLVNW